MTQNIDQQSCALTNQDYVAIDDMPEFNQFVKAKNRFLFSVTFSFLFIYILLPILAFQPILQTPIIGAITGDWLYSAGLFLMTIIVCMLYVRRAAKFDQSAAKVLALYQDRQEENSP